MNTKISGLLAAFLFASAAPLSAKTYEAAKEKSRITYFLKHPLHRVEGFTKDFSCVVEFEGDTLASSVKVKVPVLAFNSGNSNRDSHALETLEAFKYPFVEFASDSVRREGGGFRVYGQLAFHGVKRPLHFDVTPQVGGGFIRIATRFNVKLTDFGVKRPSLMLLPVEDDLKIEIDASAPGP